jgi:hypothetical protein
MHVSIYSVVTRLKNICMRDGTVRFFYPHHTGRSLWAATSNNFVDFEKFKARPALPRLFHIIMSDNVENTRMIRHLSYPQKTLKSKLNDDCGVFWVFFNGF